MKIFFLCLLFPFFVSYGQTPDSENKPTLKEVKSFLEKNQVEGVVFDGMFAGIEKLGPKTLEHLLTLLQDSEESLEFHLMVLRAIAELGNPSAIEPLKNLQEDVFIEESLKEEIPFTLYHLGETQLVEKAVENVQNQIQETQKKQDPNQPEVKKRLLDLNVALGNLAYRMQKYELGCSAYAEIQRIYPNAPILYNYACCLALDGKADKAMEKLWEALANKELHSADSLEKDGDLRSLRSRADFQDLLKKLKSKLKENY
ncbi:MAG: hypothetical protein AABZ60_05235 [Planctomycetota bacterium]